MQDFIDYLHSKDLSPVTATKYSKDVARFLGWYAREVMHCQKKDILAYLGHLKSKNLQTSSRNGVLTALRHYFDCLLDREAVFTNPTAHIRLRGINKKRLHAVYDPEELTGLADSYYQMEVKRTHEKLNPGAGSYFRQRTYLAKLRNYCILLFCIYQGPRSSEVLQIKVEDLDLRKATVTLRKGVTRGNARTLPLHAAQMGSLLQYLHEVRPQLAGHNASDLLLLPLPREGNTTCPQAPLCFKRLVQQLKRLDPRFTGLAQLRASVITHWIQTHGLRKAQYYAGHKSISSTEEYLPNVVADLAEEITQFNPF